jgi:hypothetical protein
MNTITFQCQTAVHSWDEKYNPIARVTRFEIVGELRDDGTVFAEDREWGSPEAFQPSGLAVCEGWTKTKRRNS